ncbi:MAG: hypothetical protein LBL52_00780 [Rickettsiales bacterium]|jgi:hypothetical protein|nr:hypothetical protein [Rickettsiales bacterium]
MRNINIRPGEILFRSAEEAWFWYCRYEERTIMKQRQEPETAKIRRPCHLDDVYLCVAKLYIARKISERHVKTLVKYGRLGLAPDPRIAEEERESLWWDDALDKLEQVLRAKGIVG